jgi:hypothetical protein
MQTSQPKELMQTSFLTVDNIMPTEAKGSRVSHMAEERLSVVRAPNTHFLSYTDISLSIQIVKEKPELRK